MASRHSSSRSASCGPGELRWHGVQHDPGTVELRADLPTLPAGERHILVHDADRRRRVGSAVRLRPLVAQTAHPRCPWGTQPVAVSDPNSFEDGALGPLESDAERGMERGEQEPRNALRCICINDLQDIHIGSRDHRSARHPLALHGLPLYPARRARRSPSRTRTVCLRTGVPCTYLEPPRCYHWETCRPLSSLTRTAQRRPRRPAHPRRGRRAIRTSPPPHGPSLRSRGRPRQRPSPRRWRARRSLP